MEDKEKLELELAGYVTELFEKVLDYCEVAVTYPEQYKKLRSKILRVGNNCIRKTQHTLRYYEVEYNEPEVVVEYKTQKYDERIIDDEQSPIDNNEKGELGEGS